MAVARKCEHCGNVDARVTWPSPDDAAKDPVYTRWTCPTCAWTDFDLVDAETKAQPATR